MLHRDQKFFSLVLIASLLAFCVILLGAYTRLKDAGLGCPDWPGCYGQLTVPHTQTEISQATALFPGKTVETGKAWAEMTHRYFAIILAILVFGLAIWSSIRCVKIRKHSLAVPILLAVCVTFQAILGMWTVTLKLLPLVVMAHLLGGMLVLALLWVMTLRTADWLPAVELPGLRFWAILGLVMVAIQIFLGGWTTANYASLACTDFPTCNGSFFPAMEFKQAFNFFAPVGANYQGGALDAVARATVQISHRYWGFITTLYIGILALYLLLTRKTTALRKLGWIILLLLIVQVILGILNVTLLLPMLVALAHNGVAALLLLSLVTLVMQSYAVEHQEKMGDSRA